MKSFAKHLTIPVLLMLFLPIFATCLLCYMFQDGQIEQVPFGIVDQDNSAVSRSLSKNLAESDTFHVCWYGDTAQGLKEKIENNEVIAGIIIPPHFSDDVMAGKSPSVLIVYDGCQMSAVGISKGKLNEVFMTMKVGSSLQILENKLNLQPQQAIMCIQPIGNTFRYLGNPEKSIGNYVLPGAIANIVQLAMYLFIIEAIRKEEGETIHPLLYCLFGTILSTTVLLCCICIMHLYFNIPMNGDWSTIAILGILNMFGIGNLAVLLRLCIPDKTIATQSAVLVMVMLLFSGYTYPVQGMPPCFQTLAQWLPFTYFGVPIRDVMLLGNSTQLVLSSIRWLFLFAALMAVLVVVFWYVYRRKFLSKVKMVQTELKEQPTIEQEVSSLC